MQNAGVEENFIASILSRLPCYLPSWYSPTRQKPQTPPPSPRRQTSNREDKSGPDVLDVLLSKRYRSLLMRICYHWLVNGVAASSSQLGHIG